MEIGSVAGQAIQQALNQASSTTPKPGHEAAPDAVKALENALGSQPNPNQTPPATPAAEGDMQVVPVQGAQSGSGPSLGDRILSGFGKLNEASQTALDQVASATGPQGELSPTDLLKAQRSLVQVSIQQDVTSKIAGKATQTVDTLLKNQ